MMQESALLSAKFRLPEYEDAKKIGRWTISLLFSAVRKLSENWMLKGRCNTRCNQILCGLSISGLEVIRYRGIGR